MLRKALVALVCLAAPAFARQAPQAEAERAQKRQMGKVKIIGGAGLVAVGLLKVMNSTTTAPVTSGGVVEAEKFTSGLGVAMGLIQPTCTMMSPFG